jgi:hypothetical protein
MNKEQIEYEKQLQREANQFEKDRAETDSHYGAQSQRIFNRFHLKGQE